MKAAVITNGDKKGIPELDWDEYSLIVCADGAAKWAAEKRVRVDALVGDMDSLPANILRRLQSGAIDVLQYEPVKDETDTQLAIDYAVEKGADEVCLLGALGGRLDHALANVALLLRYAKQDIRITLRDRSGIAFAASGEILLEGEPGRQVSLFPLEGEAFVHSTFGLRYPVHDRDLMADTPYFVSNVLEEESAGIYTDGWVLVVYPDRD